MQKVINVLAVLSFLGTATIIGGGTYAYLNREAYIEEAREKIAEAITEGITKILPGLLDQAVPTIPDTTGPIKLP